MICPRCKTKMVEAKRSFHKKRKWTCPKCKKVRMSAQKKRTHHLLGEQEQPARPYRGSLD